MSHNKAITRNKDPSQKYYNILVKNNNTGFDKDGNPTKSTDSVILSFDETRTIPYIHHPRDFYMSIVSFEMDTQAIPVFIADPIVGSQSIDNKLVYTITMYYHKDATEHEDYIDTTVQQQVIWFPEDNSATVPLTTDIVPLDYNNNPYYYAYTYQHFINVVNASLQSCFTALNIVDTTNPTSLFLTLENNMVTLYANLDLFYTDSLGNPASSIEYVKLYFNTELSNLFSSFASIKQPQPLSIVGTDYLNTNQQLIFDSFSSDVNVKSIPTNFSTVPPSGFQYMVVNNSEYSPLGYWNPVERILFMTAHLTVVPTLLATASNYAYSKDSYNADTQYIIADFAAQVSNGTEYKPNISYIPPAEYVLNELYGDIPLYSIAINVFWRDSFGTLHPFTLEAGGTAALKIMFRKKSFYLAE
jgi:hypothetical protein